MISVIIPAKDAAPWLGAQLEAMERQSDGKWELLVADNGSTDDTVALAQSYARSLPLRVVDASARPGPGAARNIAARAALGDFLVFTDADDVVGPTWLGAWIEAAGTIDFGTGPVVWIDDADDALELRHEGPVRLNRHMGFLPYALGTNFGIRRDLFDRLGGFDERYRTAEDVELSWRVQLTGVECAEVASAVIGKRRRTDTLGMIHQYIGYGRSDPMLFREFRPQGLVREPFAATLRSYGGLIVRLPFLFREPTRRAWAAQLGRRIGRLIGSWRCRVFLP